MSKAIDDESVRRLAELLDETGLTEIEYDNGAVKIRVARNHGGSLAYAAPAIAPTDAGAASAQAALSTPEAAAALAADHPGAVTSPMVGTVYLSPEPGAAAFINVGDSVAVG